MSFFKKIFNNDSTNIEDNEKLIYEIINGIIIEILKQSINCTDYIKNFIMSNKDAEKAFIEISIYFEFIYFFLHMFLRKSSNLLSPNKISKVQNILGPIISSDAINSYLVEWPEYQKNEFSEMFYDSLNEAEIDYASSKEFLSKEEPFTGNSILTKLARKISELTNHSNNPELMISVIEISSKAYNDIKFESFIKELNKLIS